MKTKSLLSLLSGLILASACTPEPITPLTQDYRDGIVVVNEGPFMNGTGSLTFIHFAEGRRDSTYSIANAFEQVNGRSLGNIAQSGVTIGNRLYVVVNNAGTVEVMDAKTLQSVGVISNLGLPRYIVPFGENRAVVSDWMDDRLYVIDLNTLSVVDTAETGAGPEQLFVGTAALSSSATVLFVPCSGGYGQANKVEIFNEAMNKIGEVTVGDQPQGLVADGEGNFWVLCQGYNDWAGTASTPGGLYKIDKITLQVTHQVVSMNASAHPSSLFYSADNNQLVFLSDRYTGTVVSLSVNQSQWPTTPAVNRIFYSLGYNALTGDYYGLLPLNYIGNGRLVRFSHQWQPLDSIETGIIPSYVCLPF